MGPEVDDDTAQSGLFATAPAIRVGMMAVQEYSSVVNSFMVICVGIYWRWMDFGAAPRSYGSSCALWMDES